jgi:hypothetical protein
MDVMYGEFVYLVPRGKLNQCISSFEEALRAMRKTPYHRVLGRDFLHHTRAAGDYIIEFHQKARSKKKIAALYFEMNVFAINTNRWFFSGFGYRKAGGVWDLDWLASWAAETEQDFTLKGMEPVQEVFASRGRDKNQPLSVAIAGELAEYLVTARFMQLIAAAHKAAKRRYPALRGFPVFATAHEWEHAHESR